jgi:hypothetical protein
MECVGAGFSPRGIEPVAECLGILAMAPSLKNSDGQSSRSNPMSGMWVKLIRIGALSLASWAAPR